MSDQKCNKCSSVEPVWVDVNLRESQAIESCERQKNKINPLKLNIMQRKARV